MALLGYPRRHRIIPGDSVLHGSTRRLMSAWILSREPERRRTDGPPPRHENLGDHLGSMQRSSGLRFQLFGVETFLLFPKCQSNGRDLAC
jgi:hypothetical protein